MCDWGGGPNQWYNYQDNYIHKPKPRTIRCMFNKPDLSHACGMEIHGFTGSTIYGPECDPVMQKHLREVSHYGRLRLRGEVVQHGGLQNRYSSVRIRPKPPSK